MGVWWRYGEAVNRQLDGCGDRECLWCSGEGVDGEELMVKK